MEKEATGDCAVADLPYVGDSFVGSETETALDFQPIGDDSGDGFATEPPVEFGRPLQDWFELALQAESPAPVPVRNSWGEDEEEGDDELPGEDGDEEEQDPFEDFDEDDFDDDFDDDFEEELDDEYEIEPADDGLVTEVPDEELDGEGILDEDEEVDPGIEDEV